MFRKDYFLIFFFVVLLFTTACATKKPIKKDFYLPSPEDIKEKYIAVEEAEPGQPSKRIYYKVAPWYGFKKAACSLTFDDGTRDQYMVAFPEMEKRNIKGTFFLITRLVRRSYWMDDKLKRHLFSWDQARQLWVAGHEIGSHSRTHKDLTKRGVNVKRELGGSSEKILKEIPSVIAVTLSWPYWRNNEEHQDLASEHYISARAGTGLIENYVENNIDNPKSRVINLYAVDSICIRNSEIDKPWKSYSNRIWEDGKWFVLCFHGIDDGRIDQDWLGWEPLSISQFRDILNHIEDRDFWIAPFGMVSRYIRERDSATLALKASRSSYYILSLDDGLDDAVFNQPLSIEIKIPEKWKKYRVSQRRIAIDHHITKEGYLRFSVLPDGSDIFIERVE
ncbi:MAG: polysaccharide deacetylase family protein [Spirochaetota bacterium]|nr:MAG: polysaccharide deacetylase family protein [Spirochaetota bacterium]